MIDLDSFDFDLSIALFVHEYLLWQFVLYKMKVTPDIYISLNIPKMR